MSEKHPQPSLREFTCLMALLISIVAISIDALLPSLGMIAHDFHLENPNHAQYVIGFIFIGMTIGQLICGPISDAVGRKKVLYFGIGLHLIGSVICYLANDFTMLLAGRLLQGLGVSGPYVTALSVVRDKYSGREMARVMSIVMMIFILVPAVAPSLGQAILYYASWRYVFLLYIVYSIIIGCWIAFRLEETLPPDHRIPFNAYNIIHGFKEIVRNRTTITYTICTGICFGSFIGYLNSSQQIFQVQFHTGKMFTIYFGILALILGAASLFNSRIVERLGMRLICIRGMITIVIISAVFLVVHLLFPVHLWMFLIYAGILFFCFGLMFGNLSSIAMEPMGHIAGIASAVTGAISSAISLVLGAAIGQLYNNTLIPIILGFLLLGAISLAMMLYERRFAHHALSSPAMQTLH